MKRNQKRLQQKGLRASSKDLPKVPSSKGSDITNGKPRKIHVPVRLVYADIDEGLPPLEKKIMGLVVEHPGKLTIPDLCRYTNATENDVANAVLNLMEGVPEDFPSERYIYAIPDNELTTETTFVS